MKNKILNINVKQPELQHEQQDIKYRKVFTQYEQINFKYRKVCYSLWTTRQQTLTQKENINLPSRQYE